MILVSIDPGLDLVAFARWEWERLGEPVDRALREVVSRSTAPDTPIEQRLLAIQDDAQRVCAGADLVIIERPNRGAAYDRNVHKANAVMSSLYWSTLASGALISGLARAGLRVQLLEVSTVKKDTKQAVARGLLHRTGLQPVGHRRTAWNKDELDAVAVGMQAMGDPTIARLAFPPAGRAA